MNGSVAAVDDKHVCVLLKEQVIETPLDIQERWGRDAQKRIRHDFYESVMTDRAPICLGHRVAEKSNPHRSIWTVGLSRSMDLGCRSITLSEPRKLCE